MKKRITILAVLFFLSAPLFAAEPKNYLGAAGRDIGRGTVNILTSPLEIPIWIQNYHERAGYPVVRHLAGFSVGTFKFIERAGSGAWDYLVAFIPGAQEGLPPHPETIF